MINPVGKTASEGAAGRRARSAAYRDAQAANARAAAIAKQVIHLRTAQGWTQEELATKVDTSYSAISRLESGRHEVSNKTIHKVFTALGVTPVVGYQIPARKGQPARTELIAV